MTCLFTFSNLNFGFPSLFSLVPNVIVSKYLRLYNCRDTFTHVMSALQNHLFMQNKAKFRKSQVSVTAFITRNYDQMDTWSIRKKQSQTNPNKANFYTIAPLYCLQLPLTFVNLIRNFVYEYRQ